MKVIRISRHLLHLPIGKSYSTCWETGHTLAPYAPLLILGDYGPRFVPTRNHFVLMISLHSDMHGLTQQSTEKECSKSDRRNKATWYSRSELSLSETQKEK